MAELEADFTVRLAVERAFQAAIESCIDIASHLVSTHNLGQPQEQRDLFEFLAQVGYLDEQYATTMGNLVGFGTGWCTFTGTWIRSVSTSTSCRTWLTCGGFGTLPYNC